VGAMWVHASTRAGDTRRMATYTHTQAHPDAGARQHTRTLRLIQMQARGSTRAHSGSFRCRHAAAHAHTQAHSDAGTRQHTRTLRLIQIQARGSTRAHSGSFRCRHAAAHAHTQARPVAGMQQHTLGHALHGEQEQVSQQQGAHPCTRAPALACSRVLARTCTCAYLVSAICTQSWSHAILHMGALLQQCICGSLRFQCARMVMRA